MKTFGMKIVEIKMHEEKYDNVYKKYEVNLIYSNYNGIKTRIYDFIKNHKFNKIKTDGIYIDVISDDITLEVEKIAGEFYWKFQYNYYNMLYKYLIIKYIPESNYIVPLFCDIGVVKLFDFGR